MEKIKLLVPGIPDNVDSAKIDLNDVGEIAKYFDCYEGKVKAGAPSGTLEVHGKSHLIEYEDINGKRAIVTVEQLLNSTDSVSRSVGTKKQKIVDVTSILRQRTDRSIGKLLKKVFVWKLKDTAIDLAADELVRRVASKYVPKRPGLRQLVNGKAGAEFVARTAAEQGKKEKSEPEYLVFIHGTFSSAEGSFGDLWNGNESMDAILTEKYADVLAFEHDTLFKSPFKNAIDLVKLLPEKARLSVVSYSRGGLVTDLLAADRFPEKAQKELEATYASEAKQLRGLIDKKSIVVSRHLRVGCPGSGTTLASNRLDSFLQAAANALGLLTKANPLVDAVYDLVKDLLLAAVGKKADVNVLPGLACMVPNTGFARFLRQLEASDNLHVVAGSHDGKGLLGNLVELGSQVFFGDHNDFVVDTTSMYEGALRRKFRHKLVRSRDINHFSYFSAPVPREAILSWLKKTRGTFKYLDRTSSSRSGELSSIAELLGLGTPLEQEHQPLTVRVVHADIRKSKHPVIVGHHPDEPIVSVERAVDNQMDRELTHWHKTGVYPGKKNTHKIIWNPLKPPNDSSGSLGAAIVLGLGQIGELTPAQLRETVRDAVVDYVLQLHARKKGRLKNLGLSSVIVGAGIGSRLSMLESVSEITEGVREANKKLKNYRPRRGEAEKQENTNESGQNLAISELEFIEYFEDRAISLARVMNRFKLMTERNEKSMLTVKPILQERTGGVRRIVTDEGWEWWERVLVELGSSGNLDFQVLTDRASAPVSYRAFQPTILDALIEQAIGDHAAPAKVREALFRLVFPRELNSLANEDRNLVLVVDEHTAQIPWEMLLDAAKLRAQNANATDSFTPLLTRTGCIRQLKTRFRDRQRIELSPRALVIGDPITKGFHDRFKAYEDPPPLVGAVEEAETVTQILRSVDYEVDLLVQKEYSSIVTELVTTESKILHIAAHGIHETRKELGDTKGDEGSVIGIVLSHGQVITIDEIKNLKSLPELVFLNCCHLGPKSDAKKFSTRANKLASSLSIHLISAGVRAVVAAGWAVKDTAATVFARKFYESMTTGVSFGESVKSARREAYTLHPESNTWAAYQCYGDPEYTLRRSSSGWDTGRSFEYFSRRELVHRIEKILSYHDVRNSKYWQRHRGIIKSYIGLLNTDGDYAAWQNDPELNEVLARACEKYQLWKDALTLLEKHEQLTAKSIDGLIQARKYLCESYIAREKDDPHPISEADTPWLEIGRNSTNPISLLMCAEAWINSAISAAKQVGRFAQLQEQAEATANIPIGELIVRVEQDLKRASYCLAKSIEYAKKLKCDSEKESLLSKAVPMYAIIHLLLDNKFDTETDVLADSNSLNRMLKAELRLYELAQVTGKKSFPYSEGDFVNVEAERKYESDFKKYFGQAFSAFRDAIKPPDWSVIAAANERLLIAKELMVIYEDRFCWPMTKAIDSALDIISGD